MLSAAVLLVLALKWGLWMEEKGLLAVIIMLGIAAAVAGMYWRLVSTGYQDFRPSKKVPNVGHKL